MTEPTTSSLMQRARVWLALIAMPLLLAIAVAPVAAYLALVHGLRGDELSKAVEPLAPIPVSIGFAAVFSWTRHLSKKDGLTLRDLGWTRPSSADIAVGLGTAVVLWILNVRLFYPQLRAAEPTFDPALSAIGLPTALVLMGSAIAAEDTLYRGYAFNRLLQRHGATLAVVITTIFYALLTPAPGLELKLWAAWLGTVLCLVRLWRNNLWAVAIPHACVALGPKLLATLG